MTSPTQLRLYLLRHGEVESAAAGRLLGRTDALLSARGHEQARQLGEMLSSVGLSAVYSSDLKRALKTAEAIAGRCNLIVQADTAWREINMGDWEGRTLPELHEESPDLVAELLEHPAAFTYPQGESFAEFEDRLQRALDGLLGTHQSGTVALVTHGGVCRATIGCALGLPMKNWLRLAQPYGCLNIIDWFDGQPMLLSLNASISEGVGRIKESES